MNIAQALITSGAVPENSKEDALLIGIAAANGIEYLLTWNFMHINKVIEALGYQCPSLCSPEELGVSS